MRRNEARAEGGVLRRVAAAGVAVLTAATMAVSSPLTALAAEAQGGNSPAVTVNKVATPLDENDQTDVTLSIGSTESKENVAVMFLLDKSTSQGMRTEAANMLDYLKTKGNTNILYNVVIFSGAATSTGWRDIQKDADLQDTIDNFTNRETTSGTNMDAGIELAQSEMASLPEGYETYLVTLSDGITYLWTEDGKTMSVPVYRQAGVDNSNEADVYDGAITWDLFYNIVPDTSNKSFAAVYGSFSDFLSAAPGKMSATRDDGYVYEYQTMGLDEKDELLKAYVYDKDETASIASKYATGPEFAVYEAATGFADLVAQFDHSYTYAVPEAGNNGADLLSNWNIYPWGKELMEYCNSLSSNKGQSAVSNADAEKIFSGIRDQILYEIASGTVTDVIGDDFSLTGLDTLKMTVGDKTLEGTVSGNKVTFDNGNYVVTYDEAAKTLTWEIKVPVEAANGISLSYNLTLANKEAVAGDYTVPTNESAKLDYTRHDGSTGTATFPVPEVSYSIAAETTGGFTAQKELEGAELTDGEFSFQVKDADGNVIDEATNDADGKIAFGKNMTYSAPGTYEYTISEVLPEDDDPDTAGVQKDDVTYDETVQKVTVDVKLVGNELVATWNLPKDGVKFTNVYTAEEAPAEEPAAEQPKAEEPAAEEPKKDEGVPNTGDPTSLMTVGAALVAGVGAAAAGIAVRRRNK